MADLLQQRRLSDNALLCDLSPGSMSPWYLLRDSFEYVRGAVQRVTSPDPAGGEIVLRERRENDQLKATWVAVGSSPADVWANAQTLIAAFSYVSGNVAGYGATPAKLLWQPDGTPTALEWEQVGSADWGMDYSWAALSMGFALKLPATFWAKPRSW